ncbi:5-methyltetrahydrofolate:corrinoid/iron-sulfur protein co-methyltransferase [Peptococcaceae bacterium CEB3]|nr:5-methyltetrahydrofolate:corrinoid/iron-sulfur protein co-methyltransferase [Peptococcaceae bacterium CEB3]
MLIIGEKLNSAIPSVREAMLKKDVEFIKELAKKQAAGGADFLDINTAQGNSEIDDMAWVVQAVQEVVDVPLCIDSVSPEVVKKGLLTAEGKTMLNSISMEAARLEGMLPLIKEYDCSVIALTMDDNGIPKTAEERIRIAGQLVEVFKRENIDMEKVYFDPLVLPLAVDSNNGVVFFECLSEIKRLFNGKTVSGLSNVSHSLPKRKLINRNFLTICMSHGMDAAIMDPTDAKITSALIATNLLLNKDRFSRNYLKAFRSNVLED